MSRLWPQSLFAQLMITLLVILSLAQIISGIILYYERGQSLHKILELKSVEQVSSMVRFLNELTPQAREKAIKAFNSSDLRVSFDIKPLQESTQNGNQIQKSIRNSFANVLDQNYPIHIQFIEKHEHQINNNFETKKNGSSDNSNNSRISYGINRALKMVYEMMGTWSFTEYHILIQVKLDDGSWVSFIQHFPEALFNFPHRIITTLLILVVTAFFLSLFIVHKITKPINALAFAADELGRDIERAPIDESGPQEVSKAARAFNIMQAKINQHIEDRGRLLAAISHDLKTPITRLRLRTELLNDTELANKFLSDLDDMQSMVNETLDYMCGQDKTEPIQKIDVSALISSITQDMREAGHEIEFNEGEQKLHNGYPLALKRCLTNLMENAVRYGDKATIYIEESAKMLSIRIVDEGPGIPEEQMEHIFDPFFRLESSRNRSSGGVGLGLGIARDIARVSGGEIYLHNRNEGGLEAVLELPKIHSC